MKDSKPIIVLWCVLALLLGIVVTVRMIHKRGEPPPSRIKLISDSSGRVTAIMTDSNQSVATVTYGDDANGKGIIVTNSSAPQPSGK